MTLNMKCTEINTTDNVASLEAADPKYNANVPSNQDVSFVVDNNYTFEVTPA